MKRNIILTGPQDNSTRVREKKVLPDTQLEKILDPNEFALNQCGSETLYCTINDTVIPYLSHRPPRFPRSPQREARGPCLSPADPRRWVDDGDCRQTAPTQRSRQEGVTESPFPQLTPDAMETPFPSHFCLENKSFPPFATAHKTSAVFVLPYITVRFGIRHNFGTGT
jgi:hypothetical protein